MVDDIGSLTTNRRGTWVPALAPNGTDISAEDAILRQARRSRSDLIVLGVSRRPGKTLSFGELATALLESSDRSLMFVAPVAVAARRSNKDGGAATTERASAA